VSDTAGAGVGANDATVSASDPSTWAAGGDLPEQANAAIQRLLNPPVSLPEVAHHLPGIHDPRPSDNPELDALRAELADLCDLHEASDRKLQKSYRFAAAAEAECERLTARIAEVDAQIKALSGGESDGLVG
jgi:hypothetical protein